MKISSFSTAILAVISTISSDAATIEDENTGATRMVLGSQLDNPYTVSSMQDAAKLVAGASPKIGPKSQFPNGERRPAGPAVSSITATHKYVKMTPRKKVSDEMHPK